MQNCEEKSFSQLFEYTYKVLCHEKNVKPLPTIQNFLQKNCLRFCADHVNLKEWSPLLNSIMQDRSLSKIHVYSRCRRKKIREKMDTEEKLIKLCLQVNAVTKDQSKRERVKKIRQWQKTMKYIDSRIAKWQMDWHSAHTFRRCVREDRRQPVLYTNCLLRCFVHSVAVCLKNSSMITSLTLDGIPLAPKYLRILADGLTNNRNLRSLSLVRCQIGDAGCSVLLESLQCNSSLRVLNLSSCCLTNRSATCLSSFFRKRKADLLQSIWKGSTLLRDARTTVEEGLRVLILDRNFRFSDTGLRQLIRMLKNDFWLKILRLRCCGITQHGGEMVLELLQTNSVLTQIDLRDNEVSAEILQIICKILKKRENKDERILTKKRLLSHEQIFVPTIIPKDQSFQHIPKENRFLKTPALTQIKMQTDYILQTKHVRKMKRKDNRLHSAIKRNHNNWNNVDKLKGHLSVMIEHSRNLIRDLENGINFLLKERDRRLSAEEAYHKVQPRLRNLKNKIAMQNSIHSSMRYENQLYANLQNVFNDLKISTNEIILGTDDTNLSEEASKNKIKSDVCYNKNQPFTNEIDKFLYRRSNCPK